MANAKDYTFRIDPYTPETIPMERLAAYMADLAALLGEPERVHFVRLDPGSTAIIHRVDSEAIRKVEDRLAGIRRGDGPPDAMAAFDRINGKLRQDNGAGVLSADGAEIIPFPGVKARIPVAFGAFNQEGSLDGVVIRLGGTQNLVPVHIQSGSVIHSKCETSREVARKLGSYIFGGQIRVFGTGRWFKDDGGNWILERFLISHFEPLDETPLSEVVSQLRSIEGSEWPSLKDPWAELDVIRNGPRKPS